MRNLLSQFVFFNRNKYRKKFWVLLIFNLFCYATVFPIGLLVSFIWWFTLTSKTKKKTKKIVAYSTIGLIFLTTSWGVYAYHKDPQPTLKLNGIEDRQVIKSPNVDLVGEFEPANFSVYINGEKIKTKDGQFTYDYPLELGENKITVKVANFKSVEKEYSHLEVISKSELNQPFVR